MPKALKDLLKEEGADEALLSNPTLADVPDALALARRMIDTKAHVGRAIIPPGESATAEERAEFSKRLMEKVPGAAILPKDPIQRREVQRGLGLLPKSGEEYSLPEGVSLPDEFAAVLRKEAVEDGLDTAGFAARARRVADKRADEARAQESRRQEVRAALGDGYEPAMAEFAQVAGAFGLKELKAAVERRDINAETAAGLRKLVKAVGSSARELGEHGPGGGASGMTREEAIKEERKLRAEIIADPYDQELKKTRLDRLQVLAAIISPDLARQAG